MIQQPPVSSVPDAQAALRSAERVGREVLAPRAEQTDVGAEPPRQNFAALGEAGLLGLAVPIAYGGLGLDPITVLQVKEILARYCGLTPFLLTQHTGVCGSIAGGGRDLAATILPLLARGELLVGIGASQLRRGGEPLLRARPVEGGYLLDGTVPWASGRGLMTHLALGAVVEGSGPLFFWVPFVPAPGISFSAPMDLMVMRAARTVSVTCESLFVPDSSVLYDDRSGSWRVEHGGPLSNPVAYLLGVGAACLDGLAERVAGAGSPSQRDRVDREREGLHALRDRYYALLRRMYADRQDTAVLDSLLALRVEASAQVLHMAGLAVAAEGGTAHLRSNPAQRHLREASFFSTVTVNAAVREAMITGF